MHTLHVKIRSLLYLPARIIAQISKEPKLNIPAAKTLFTISEKVY